MYFNFSSKIVKNFSKLQLLRVLKSLYSSEQRYVISYILKLIANSCVVFRATSTAEVCVLGTELGWELFESELQNMLELFLNEFIGVQYSTVSCTLFSRAYIKGNTYHSLLYKRATKQNSYTIKYVSDSDMKYGQVKCFTSVSAPHLPNEQPITICVVETFDNGEVSYLETSLPSSSTLLNAYLQGFFATTTDRKKIQFVKAENIVSPCIKLM